MQLESPSQRIHAEIWPLWRLSAPQTRNTTSNIHINSTAAAVSWLRRRLGWRYSSATCLLKWPHFYLTGIVYTDHICYLWELDVLILHCSTLLFIRWWLLPSGPGCSFISWLIRQSLSVTTVIQRKSTVVGNSFRLYITVMLPDGWLPFYYLLVLLMEAQCSSLVLSRHMEYS